jgi:hypothetical protein
MASEWGSDAPPAKIAPQSTKRLGKRRGRRKEGLRNRVDLPVTREQVGVLASGIAAVEGPVEASRYGEIPLLGEVVSSATSQSGSAYRELGVMPRETLPSVMFCLDAGVGTQCKVCL